MPSVVVVTGIMAAGKSTVSQALAQRLPRSVHVRGDIFRRFVVNGYAAMSATPSEEALSHLRLRYRLAASTTDAYVDAGFSVVVQDIVIGSMLTEFLDMIRTRPIGLVVLVPSAVEVARRETDRAKTGYTDFTPAELDRGLRESTPRIGLWLDSTNLSVDETVDAILENVDALLIN